MAEMESNNSLIIEFKQCQKISNIAVKING